MALAFVLAPDMAASDHLSVYSYTVLRDGEPIGTHRVTVSPSGTNGDSHETLQVKAETDLEVTFGPLTLYRMEHLREEVWRGGKLEAMTAYTDKNGAIYDIAITREPEGYRRVINGRTDHFESSMRVLALWHDDLFEHQAFLSPIEDKTHEISVDFVGQEKIDLIGRSVDAFFYRMSGSTNRELWYDAEGHIMKVRLLDHSDEIEYVLSDIDGAAPGVAKAQQADQQPQDSYGPRTRLAASRTTANASA